MAEIRKPLRWLLAPRHAQARAEDQQKVDIKTWTKLLDVQDDMASRVLLPGRLAGLRTVVSDVVMNYRVWATNLHAGTNKPSGQVDGVRGSRTVK